MATRIARRLHPPVVFRQQRLPPDHPRRAPARSAVVPRGGFPMKHMPTACCLLAGLAIAASGTASAQDARPDKPPMSIEQRQALGEAMAQRNRDLKQPRTEAEALTTLVRRPEGGESMQGPTAQRTTRSIRNDAQGRLPPAPSKADTTP